MAVLAKALASQFLEIFRQWQRNIWLLFKLQRNATLRPNKQQAGNSQDSVAGSIAAQAAVWKASRYTMVSEMYT